MNKSYAQFGEKIDLFNARTTRGKILAKIYFLKGVAPIRMDAPYSTQHCLTACAYCALHIRILAKYEILTRYI